MLHYVFILPGLEIKFGIHFGLLFFNIIHRRRRS
uniref:Uncharacterized protein n=1 Tax=Anguilla anguilla TaxID=7936 RepID=A0A0E9U9I7_ANGAN